MLGKAVCWVKARWIITTIYFLQFPKWHKKSGSKTQGSGGQLSDQWAGPIWLLRYGALKCETEIRFIFTTFLCSLDSYKEYLDNTPCFLLSSLNYWKMQFCWETNLLQTAEKIEKDNTLAWQAGDLKTLRIQTKPNWIDPRLLWGPITWDNW